MTTPVPAIHHSEFDEPGSPDATMLNEWHVVAFSSDVPGDQLKPIRLLGRDLVLWRDASGEVHVWEDLCIHRGSRLSKGWITDGKVVCPYHGWSYDSTARCVLIPATPSQPPPVKARAFPYRAQERYGFVWASLGEPEHDIPAFPEWDDGRYIKVHAGEYLWKSSGFRALENFVDITHFPWVHAGVNGVQAMPDEIHNYEVTRDANGLSTPPIPVYQPYGDPRDVPVNAAYAYRVMRPLVAYFSKGVVVAEPTERHPANPDDRFCTYFTAQPIDEVSCYVRICTARNFSPELTVADVLRRQDLVYTQDRDIVETQRPERIPLSLREELHHRTDRLGQEYRRWLAAMGITYGAID